MDSKYPFLLLLLSKSKKIAFFPLLLNLLCAAAAAATTKAAFNVSTVPFSVGFSHLFGDNNLIPSSDDTSVQLLLNHYTGSGFRSSELYNYGFFSARIKLPSEYTAGIVVAFYTTNGDVFEKTHDELDFEFLGNVKGKEWRFQTNVYGNGSTSRGREERYYLGFDPSKEFHQYSILWTPKKIIFYIDETPIREVVNSEAMGGDYPSKPMSLYATIWDASTWATSGGKYKVDYKYAPFVAQFTDLVLHGCPLNPIQDMFTTTTTTTCADQKGDDQLESLGKISTKQRMGMKMFRQKFMYYSYCYDTLRYPIPPPECVIDPMERQRFKDTGRLKFDQRHRGGRRHPKRSRNQQVSGRSRKHGNQEDEEE